jgi:hypothetical protein
MLPSDDCLLEATIEVETMLDAGTLEVLSASTNDSAEARKGRVAQ